ncbi:DMT family transporter [Pusillimonas noertemannii]|uniref:EamA-like transporter family protein n=1 Tax=Pusillimonas noertemannii TaxID=305977 RepID=A0A2U1CNU9_9BURK|nr:DMT family transporter [Pusillimonas noertemannii]NYT68370.1 DMT family transporter [Pusillimonas noertemannii]PVY62614.1 EamA-like transporter family protein [Pusillimonas noertemannii]TFL10441.1 DMT family transporter [Pusillimonas noertemannii]
MSVFPLWLRGGLMLAATAMTWGGMFPVMKPLLEHVDPFTIALIRFGFSVPILIAILLFIEGPSALNTQGKALRLWWLGTLGFFGFGVLAIFGLESIRPEHAAVVPALMPLISIVVISVRTRRPPRPPALLAIALGLAGVTLVASRGDPAALLHGTETRGLALVFVGVTSWVFYTLAAAEFPSWSGLRYTTLTLTLAVLSILAMQVIALALGAIKLPTLATLVSFTPSFGYLVLLASVMGFLFWNAGMRALGPAHGVLFINLVPVTAFSVSLMQGHIPTGWELAGVALVISALVLNSFSTKRQTSKAQLASING